MITKNHRQEALSRAYVQAVAGRCGLSCSFRDFDYGIDITLHDLWEVGERRVESSFRIDLQLRSAADLTMTATHVEYDLEAGTYASLRLSGLAVPRILVLLVLPSLEADWTAQSEDRLELRRCAYWASFVGMPASKNKRTVRVRIPRTNVFSVEALNELMDRVRNGEVL